MKSNSTVHLVLLIATRLLKWARAFCKHILNHRLDEELFEHVQFESGRTTTISLKKCFHIRWDAEAVMLQKMVLLKHNINALVAHAKFSGPKDLTPDRMEHIQVVLSICITQEHFLLNLRQKLLSKTAESFS